MRISRPKNLLSLGPLDITGKAVLGLFAVERENRQVCNAALLHLGHDEVMPGAPERFCRGLLEIVQSGCDLRVGYAGALRDEREIRLAGGGGGQAAATFVDFIIQYD